MIVGMETSSKRSWREVAGWSLITSLWLITTLAILHPTLRQAVQTEIFKPYRKVLSTVVGDVFGIGWEAEIAKVKTEKGIAIEVYGRAEEGVRPLITRIQLPDRRDGFFHFRGEAANLALHDISDDGHVEILAPTFDDNLIAHLNIYRFSPEQGRFEPSVQPK